MVTTCFEIIVYVLGPFINNVELEGGVTCCVLLGRIQMRGLVVE